MFKSIVIVSTVTALVLGTIVCNAPTTQAHPHRFYQISNQNRGIAPVNRLYGGGGYSVTPNNRQVYRGGYYGNTNPYQNRQVYDGGYYGNRRQYPQGVIYRQSPSQVIIQTGGDRCVNCYPYVQKAGNSRYRYR